MKRNFVFTILFCVFALLLISCNNDEPAVNPTAGLTKIADGYALGAATRVEMWAKEELFAGYNKLALRLYDSASGSPITDSQIHFHPTMEMSNMSHGCPVEDPQSVAKNLLFDGAIMFTMPSGDFGSWSVDIKIQNHNNASAGMLSLPITVKNTEPSRIISFKDEATSIRYFLSYNFRNDIGVGVNDFKVIVFEQNAHDYVPVDDFVIKMNPEMPSMDHGSPNNIHPTHVGNGHYNGKVNFTMTGEWRINLELARNGSPLGTKAFNVLVK